jgi:hypothetical protein
MMPDPFIFESPAPPRTHIERLTAVEERAANTEREVRSIMNKLDGIIIGVILCLVGAIVNLISK